MLLALPPLTLYVSIIAPILLATVGSTACLFDLRTSLLSGVDDTSGGRPYARFTTPDSDSTMVHCSYSHDESLHIFSTLDSSGVVRLWDDRKCSSLSTSADCCLTSFLAHTRTGVGISAMPPSQSDDKSNATSRWMTWGLDLPVHGIEAVDELAVKVWDPLPKQTQQSRAATMSTVSADEDDLDKSEERRWLDSFHVTSHMSMQGAVAARVHPLAPGACSRYILESIACVPFIHKKSFTPQTKLCCFGLSSTLWQNTMKANL